MGGGRRPSPAPRPAVPAGRRGRYHLTGAHPIGCAHTRSGVRPADIHAPRPRHARASRALPGWLRSGHGSDRRVATDRTGRVVVHMGNNITGVLPRSRGAAARARWSYVEAPVSGSRPPAEAVHFADRRGLGRQGTGELEGADPVRRCRTPSWSASARRRRSAPAGRPAAARTVSGDPIACPSRRSAMNSRSSSVYGYAAASSGRGAAAPAAPAAAAGTTARSARPATRPARRSRRTTALTATIAYGSSSQREGRKFSR